MMTMAEMIELSFDNGWEGTADKWWAQHPWVTTINSIAPTFTHLKQEGIIVKAGDRERTRSGGLATPYRKAAV
jgi:hypothetical protein